LTVEDNGQDIFPMGEAPDLMSEPIRSSAERGSFTPPEAAPKPEAQQAPAGPWWKEIEGKEVEYTADGGKNVKEPFAKVLERAKMGYHYAQRMESLKREREDFENSRKGFEADTSWKEIVDYAKQDPAWAEHTRQAFERRNQWQQENADNPLLSELNKLKSELGPLRQIADEWKQERQKLREGEEIKAVDAEIKDVAERYSKLGVDLNAIDKSSGLTMESTVIDYAVKHGIKSFKTAFLEVYGDTLESKREEALKTQWAKEQAQRQKQGFIGRTPTPQLGPKVLQNPSSKSWDDVGTEAIAAYKSGQY
jgi:hypothetical protein